MGIFSRFTDIVSANVNAILDQAENPEKIIRLMISEMEDTLVEVRAQAARTIADRKDLERHLCRARRERAEWETRAERALKKGREDLARSALVEKHYFEEAIVGLEVEFEDIDESMGRYDEDVTLLEKKLREVRAKQKSVVTREITAVNAKRVREQLYDPRIEDAFARFDAMERRIDRTEAEVEAFDLGDGVTLEREIEYLDRDDKLNEELAELKQRVQAA